MSYKIEGSSCAHCKAYLFSDDDIVYCPVCGAPHHRDCYNSLGHCALESLHGTENEYSREKEIENQEKIKEREEENRKNSQTAEKRCNICGEMYPAVNSRCPKCGAPDLNSMGGFVAFDPLGGVPADYKIDENVTAEDAKKFVLANTHRYIPKFISLNKESKISWNWLAFLFPSGWMLSRKMFKGGIIVALLTIIFSLFSLPFKQSLYNYGIDSMSSYNEIFKIYSQIDFKIILFSVIGTFFDFGLRIIIALLGDYFYKSHTVESIKKIKSQSSDIEQDYRKKGGVNIFYFLLASLVMQYASNIIYAFI